MTEISHIRTLRANKQTLFYLSTPKIFHLPSHSRLSHVVRIRSYFGTLRFLSTAQLAILTNLRYIQVDEKETRTGGLLDRVASHRGGVG